MSTPPQPRVATLETERQTAELSRLAGLGADLEWLNIEAAKTATLPLITTGLNLLSAEQQWRPVIQARTQAGLGTIAIPGFKPGDYGPVAGAPTALEAVAAQVQSIHWDGLDLRVPASVAFRTKLHASKWCVLDGVGALLLSYRPTHVHGCVIFCGASLGSRRPGAEPGDQLRLLQRLIQLAAPTLRDQAATKNTRAVPANSQQKMTAAEFLSSCPDIAPHVLLLLLSGWNPPDPETHLGRSLFGFEPDSEFRAAAARVQSSAVEIESALRHAGWGPFLRKLQERLAELTEDNYA